MYSHLNALHTFCASPSPQVHSGLLDWSEFSSYSMLPPFSRGIHLSLLTRLVIVSSFSLDARASV